MVSPGFWLSAFSPRLLAAAHLRAASTFWNGSLTPAGWWPFAAIGLLAAPAGLRLRLLAWWLVMEVPVLQKASPVADAVRLQLPIQPLWALLVGVGAASLPGRLVPWIPAGLGAAWLLGHPGFLRWANHAEYDVLAARVPGLRTEDRVLFDDPGSRAGKFARVMEVLGPARWVRASDWIGGAVPEGPTLWWRGVPRDPEIEAAIEARCRFAPVAVEHLDPVTDEDVRLPVEGVDVGFWRVEGCG